MNQKKHWPLVAVILLLLCLFMTGCSAKKNDSTKLQEQINAYITKTNADGTLDRMAEYWVFTPGDKKDLDYSALSAENGTIHCASKSSKPFSYIQNNAWTGYSIEMIYNFCKENGYGMEVKDYGDMNSVVLAIQSGKEDIGVGSTSITEERKEIVDFSVPFFLNKQKFAYPSKNDAIYQSTDDLNGKNIGVAAGTSTAGAIGQDFPNSVISEYNNTADMCIALSQNKVDTICGDEATLFAALENYPEMMVGLTYNESDQFGIVFPKSGTVATSLTEPLRLSFERTLIESNRWQLLLQGIGNTLLITLSSILLGSILGFFVYLLCRKGGKVSNVITKFCITVIDGLPVVVFLMILYYVIFGSLNLNNILVSVIAFTLIFASAVFSMMKNAVSSIDQGQYEVSFALGYTSRQTFFKMILPQALPLFWPPCSGAVKSQIKATAIVGYIAALDLTKAGDMIRSSTYEAFFPLIITALIYFILGWLLSKLVELIGIHTAPSTKKTERYLNGVKR